MPANPTSSVRGPKHVVKKGKTPVLAVDEARVAGSNRGRLPGRHAPSGADRHHGLYLCACRRRDPDERFGRSMSRAAAPGFAMHEKGGKRHEMPCHHILNEYLQAYMEGAGIKADAKRGGMLPMRFMPSQQHAVYVSWVARPACRSSAKRRFLPLRLNFRPSCPTARPSIFAIP